MSTQDEYPEFVDTENIRTPKFGMRERHTPEDIKRIAEDIKRKQRLTKMIRVVPLTILYPSTAKYEGLYGLVGGTARLVALRQLNIKRLRVGVDVFIEKKIHNVEEFFDEYWLDNDLAVGWTWIDRMDAAAEYDSFGWTQTRIAERVGYQDNSMVSLLLKIRRILPFEVSHDPIVEKAGPKRAHAIARMWEKNEKDGRAMYERLQKDPTGIPSEKRINQVAYDYVDKGLTLGASLGSPDYDNSSIRLEERTDYLLKLWKKTAKEEGTRGPPFGGISEAWSGREVLDMLGKGTSNPDVVISLEMISKDLHHLANSGPNDLTMDGMKSHFSRKANEVDGVIEKMKGGSVGTVVDGIRKSFPKIESEAKTSS